MTAAEPSTTTDSQFADVTLARADYWIALGLAVLVLALYMRTLAPGLLYGDSGEFQVLPYTLGLGHTNGYPIYLLAARVFSILPIGSLAWRINLFSAVGAAVTVGGIYLIARHLTRSRVGAALGAITLAISYTLWSQAVIAEVYGFATAVLVIILLLLCRWEKNPARIRLLFWAALLGALGPGIHFMILLAAPAAAILVLSRRASRQTWTRILVTIAAGGALGLTLFVGTFLLMDAQNSPTSYQNVVLSPSRSIWNLTEADMDTPLERLYLALYTPQWKSAMFPDDLNLRAEFETYVDLFTTQEFAPVAVIGALFGLVMLLVKRSRLGLVLILMLVSMLFVILNYNPGDKYIFFLPTYMLLAVALAVGIGTFLGWAQWLAAKVRPGGQAQTIVATVGDVILLVLIVVPFWAARIPALESGRADLISDSYVLGRDPSGLDTHQVAELFLQSTPDDSLLLLDWRTLYAVYYVAHIERGLTGIRIVESTPYGSGDKQAESLIALMNDTLAAGHPVYADRVTDTLRQHFRDERVPGSPLFQLFPKTD